MVQTDIHPSFLSSKLLFFETKTRSPVSHIFHFSYHTFNHSITMSDVIRDAPIGQLIRYVTRNRVLQYPEEKPDFVCPTSYSHPEPEKPASQLFKTVPSLLSSNNSIKDDFEKETPDSHNDLKLTRTATDHTGRDLSKANTSRSALSRVGSRIALEQSKTRADLEQAFAAASEPSPWPEPVIPVRTAEGVILVDWYTTDDKANPQNWSKTKKGLVTLLICIYTTAVYTGSAIYTPSAEGVMERFGVGATAAALGISLFVLAYGLGPLIFSPLSEIPKIGRNPPYIITFAIFTILCVPTALADNFAGLMVLRFLQGFFGSPILATGGASLQDMFSLIKLPYILCCWAAAACVGPALGPIISGFSVAAENWRWSLWEMLWLAAPVWLALFFFLPETYPETILLRRAQRLRKLTGNQNLKAQSEINQAQRSFKDLVVEALWRPLQLIALDPAIVSLEYEQMLSQTNTDSCPPRPTRTSTSPSVTQSSTPSSKSSLWSTSTAMASTSAKWVLYSCPSPSASSSP